MYAPEAQLPRTGLGENELLPGRHTQRVLNCFALLQRQRLRHARWSRSNSYAPSLGVGNAAAAVKRRGAAHGSSAGGGAAKWRKAG